MRLSLTDIDIATKILTDDSVFDMICDDGITEEFKSKFVRDYLEHPAVFMLHPNKWTIFIFTPRNTIMYEAHTAIVTDGRGKSAKKAGCDVLDYMFEKTGCQKIISLVPTFNRLAGIFARWCNLKREGTISESFLKNGKLYDQIIYGISKKEWEKCQQQSQ